VIKDVNAGFGEVLQVERRPVKRRGGFTERLKRRASALKERRLEDAVTLTWLEAFAAETPFLAFSTLAATGLLEGISDDELLELFCGNGPFNELYR
jgi:hypothetical protein